ncbi:restriction endonuclease subunit S [Lactobacillus johnsonii]|uniref:restriction endonuclease subunit S n=1 Tax=Lactobacillus johnsonii TaxID=33959 RepID=UPI003F26811D
MKTNSLDFDAQALREKILDLAMRGKLVKQDPNDEPASVLLEKIKAEKAELVKEGKIKKNKPLPEITDDEKPFDIPESWEWVRLGDAANIIMGQAPKGTTVNELGEGIEFHQGKTEFTDKIIGKSLKYTTSDNKIIDDKYIIMAVRAPVGDVNLLNRKISIGRGLAGIMPYVSNKEYIFYYLDSIKSYFEANSTGSTFKAINGNTIKNAPIPLPPLSEQSRIAAKIAQLFALLRKVESSTQQYAKLQSLLKSKVLDLAMRGKLVKQDPNDEPASVLLEKIKAEKEQLIKEKKIKRSKPLPPISDEEKPFKIPDSWEWVRLGEVLALEDGSIRRGPFGSSLKKTYFVPKGKNTYKVYEQGNAINQSVSYGHYYISKKKFNELRSFSVRPQDIIISGAGTIGKTFVLPADVPAGVINQALIRVRLNNRLITNDYFLIAFQQKVNLLNKRAKGTAIKNMFSIAHMKNDIVWALPPISEQNRIVRQFKKMNKII